MPPQLVQLHPVHGDLYTSPTVYVRLHPLALHPGLTKTPRTVREVPFWLSNSLSQAVVMYSSYALAFCISGV